MRSERKGEDRKRDKVEEGGGNCQVWRKENERGKKKGEEGGKGGRGRLWWKVGKKEKKQKRVQA